MIYLNIGSNLESSFGNRFKNIELAISLMKNENIFIKKNLVILKLHPILM